MQTEIFFFCLSLTSLYYIFLKRPQLCLDVDSSENRSHCLLRVSHHFGDHFCVTHQSVYCVCFWINLSWRPRWAKEGHSSATLSFTSVLPTRCSSVSSTRRSQGEETHMHGRRILSYYVYDVSTFFPIQTRWACLKVPCLGKCESPLPNLSFISVFPLKMKQPQSPARSSHA